MKVKNKAKRANKAKYLNEWGEKLPLINPDNNFDEEYAAARSWYIVRWSTRDYRGALKTYVKSCKQKKYVYAIGAANISEIRDAAILCELETRDQNVPLDKMEEVFSVLENIFKKYPKPQKETNKVSIQERMDALAKKFGADIDGEIDNFIINNCKSDFCIKNYISINQISGPVCKKIAEFYNSLLSELHSVIEGKDADLKEGYSTYTRPQIKRYAEFVQTIIEACKLNGKNVERKPRKRKVKPAAVIVNSLKYMKRSDELGIDSAKASDIVGASELWVFNTQKRKLSVFFAADPAGLSVSGSSIRNYDVYKSLMKNVRDPKTLFKDFAKTNKRTMKNMWNNIRSKETPAKPRMNEHTLILAVN